MPSHPGSIHAAAAAGRRRGTSERLSKFPAIGVSDGNAGRTRTASRLRGLRGQVAAGGRSAAAASPNLLGKLGIGKGAANFGIASLIALLIPGILDSLGIAGPETRRLDFDKELLGAQQAAEAAGLRIGEKRRAADVSAARGARAAESADLRAILQSQENIAGLSFAGQSGGDAAARIRALTQAGAVGRHNAAAANLGLL